MEFELPKSIKKPSIPDPPKFKGSKDHREFMEWLTKYLDYLQTLGNTGRDKDHLQIIWLANHLEGPAHNWYSQEIDNADAKDRGHYQTFADVVCLMHKRFVRAMTTHTAMRDFDHAEYSRRDGVNGYYHRLVKFAKVMVQHPGEYHIKQQFMDGLLTNIHNVLMDDSIYPESVSLDYMLAQANVVESRLERHKSGDT